MDLRLATLKQSLAGKVFTHKCDTGNLSALIQCCNIVQQIERDCFSVAKRRSIHIRRICMDLRVNSFVTVRFDDCFTQATHLQLRRTSVQTYRNNSVFPLSVSPDYLFCVMFAQTVFKDCYQEGNDTVSVFFIPSPELRLSRYAMIDPKCRAFN